MFGKKNEKIELLKDLIGTRAAYAEFVKNVDLSKEEKDVLLRASVEVRKKTPNNNIIDQAHAILVQKSFIGGSSDERQTQDMEEPIADEPNKIFNKYSGPAKPNWMKIIKPTLIVLVLYMLYSAVTHETPSSGVSVSYQKPTQQKMSVQTPLPQKVSVQTPPPQKVSVQTPPRQKVSVQTPPRQKSSSSSDFAKANIRVKIGDRSAYWGNEPQSYNFYQVCKYYSVQPTFDNPKHRKVNSDERTVAEVHLDQRLSKKSGSLKYTVYCYLKKRNNKIMLKGDEIKGVSKENITKTLENSCDVYPPSVCRSNNLVVDRQHFKDLKNITIRGR